MGVLKVVDNRICNGGRDCIRTAFLCNQWVQKISHSVFAWGSITALAGRCFISPF